MTCSRKMLSELRLAVGCFVAFHLVLVLLNIRAEREQRLDTLRHASSLFPWAECTNPALPFHFKGQKGLAASKESRAEDAVKRRPCMQRALYIIGLSCVSAVSCCVAFDLQQRSSPGDVVH